MPDTVTSLAVNPTGGQSASFGEVMTDSGNTIVRLKCDLAYDGTDFHGWARQPGLVTVQGEVEAALGRLLHLYELPRTVVAGRTDAGVHARGQVFHVDVEAAAWAAVDPTRLLRGLAAVLPRSIRVQAIGLAAPGFDARFGALWRNYVYRLADHPAACDPLNRAHVVWWPRPLDLAAINAAAPILLGEHDFAAFAKPRLGASTVRTLLQLEAGRRADGVIELAVRADAFCHSMVRWIAGALVAIGQHQRDTAWLAAALASADHSHAARVMPALGLTLEQVGYPPDADLATQAIAARVRRGPVHP